MVATGTETAVRSVDVIAELIEPRVSITLLAADADNRILECATDGGVGLIVTGDKEMLALRDYEGIWIASLRDYLESH